MVRKDKKNLISTDYSVDHCIQRAKERYSLDITSKDYDLLNQLVTLFLSKHQKRGEQDDFAMIFDIEKQGQSQIFVLKIKNFKGTEIFVNYDQERACVTTILPPILKGPKSSRK